MRRARTPQLVLNTVPVRGNDWVPKVEKAEMPPWRRPQDLHQLLHQLVLAGKAALEKVEDQMGRVSLRGLVQDHPVAKPSKNPINSPQLVRRKCAYRNIRVGHLGAR